MLQVRCVTRKEFFQQLQHHQHKDPCLFLLHPRELVYHPALGYRHFGGRLYSYERYQWQCHWCTHHHTTIGWGSHQSFQTNLWRYSGSQGLLRTSSSDNQWIPVQMMQYMVHPRAMHLDKFWHIENREGHLHILACHIDIHVRQSKYKIGYQQQSKQSRVSQEVMCVEIETLPYLIRSGSDCIALYCNQYRYHVGFTT